MFQWLSELKAMGRREAARAAALVAAGVLALAVVVLGAVFLALAFYLWLEGRIGAPLAALGTAAAAFLAAFAVLLIARLMTARRGPAKSAEAAQDPSGALGQIFGGSLSATLERHGAAAAVAALLAGFAFGASPRLRRALLALLKDVTDA